MCVCVVIYDTMSKYVHICQLQDKCNVIAILSLLALRWLVWLPEVSGESAPTQFCC